MSYKWLTVGLNKLEDLEQGLHVLKIIIAGVFIMWHVVKGAAARQNAFFAN